MDYQITMQQQNGTPQTSREITSRGVRRSRRRIAYMTGLGLALVALLGAARTGDDLVASDAFTSKTIDVGIVVADLERSLAFYEDVIGMKRVGSFDVPGDLARRAGLTDGRPMRAKILQLGEGEGATQWKLVQTGDQAETEPDTYIHDRAGMRYITLHVTALAPLVERLRRHGVPLRGETPIELGDGNSFVLVQDPDGIFLELIGPM